MKIPVEEHLLGQEQQSPFIQSTNTAYFVRAEGGACGNTGCVNISINVLDAYAYMPPFDTLCGMGYPFDLTNGVPEGGVYSGDRNYEWNI